MNLRQATVARSWVELLTDVLRVAQKFQIEGKPFPWSLPLLAKTIETWCAIERRARGMEDDFGNQRVSKININVRTRTVSLVDDFAQRGRLPLSLAGAPETRLYDDTDG